MIIYLIVINILTFILFGFDKLSAVIHKKRISENNLLGLSMLGGCFLEFLGMFIFRHKIRKFKFYIINIISIIGYTIILINK